MTLISNPKSKTMLISIVDTFWICKSIDLYVFLCALSLNFELFWCTFFIIFYGLILLLLTELIIYFIHYIWYCVNIIYCLVMWIYKHEKIIKKKYWVSRKVHQFPCFIYVPLFGVSQDLTLTFVHITTTHTPTSH